MTTVRTAEEFLVALQRKDDEICILGAYCSEIGDTVRSRVSISDYPVSLSPATGNVALYTGLMVMLIESIINLVTKLPKDMAKIERLLKLYSCTKFTTEDICLRLKQLDY